MLHAQGIGRKPAETVFKELDEHLSHIESLVTGRPFILGDKLTLADVAIFSQINGLLTPLTPDTKKAVESRAGLMKWYRSVDGATSSGAAGR